MSKVAFGLTRVSTSEQVLDSQKDSIRKIAKSFGYTIAEDDFFEEKITGYDEDDLHDRDSIVQLSNRIKVQKPDAIFIYELSRLTRRAIKVSHYIDTLSVQPRIPMYFCDYELWTLNTETLKPNDDAILKLQGGAQAVEIERERIKARTSRGRDAKAEKGYYVGSVKDGYTWELDADGEKRIIVDEERKPTIKLIYDLYLKEMSTGEIRDYLNARIDEHPSPNRYRLLHKNIFKGYKEVYKDRTGNLHKRSETLWTDAMVSNILSDEWYKGIRHYHLKNRKNSDKTKPTLTLNVEPIIDEASWEACNKRLSQFRMRVGTSKQIYLLSGLLFCGVCGRKIYGHSDGGYDDMYYCSSYDYGKKNRCGLKWVRRQNLDAIIYNVVRSRVYNDITYGEKSPFSDFFSIDKNKLDDISTNITTYRSLIDNATQKIDEANRQISFYIQQQGKYLDNPKMIDNYQQQIDLTQKQIEKEEATIRTYERNIDKLKKQKKLFASVDNKLIEVNSIEDFSKVKELFNHVISKITLHNPDKTNTVIEINYVNGKKDTVIYSPTRLAKRYILLTKDIENIAPYVSYNTERKRIVFDSRYFAISSNAEAVFDESAEVEDSTAKEIKVAEGGVSFGKWNTPTNQKRFFDECRTIGISEAQATQLYDDAIKNHRVWNTIEDGISYYRENGYKVFKDELSVKEYIELRRDSTLNVYQFADLLPMSEKGLKSKKYHEEYIKRYNTGKPSFTPFIVKDADYDEIQKKRKHLYNRKWKILNNKRLTQQEKDDKIFEIMEQLDAFKYQLKYLPANKKGMQHIEKYNK